jgi:hypothetical protein
MKIISCGVFSLSALPVSSAFIFQPMNDNNSKYLGNLKPSKTVKELPVDAVATAPTTTVDRNAADHKRWGVDYDHPNEYWFDARIHTLGNVGFGGAVHAACAPFATKLIDMLAYDGVDIRGVVSWLLLLDVGGMGYLARELTILLQPF